MYLINTKSTQTVTSSCFLWYDLMENDDYELAEPGFIPTTHLITAATETTKL